MTQDHVLMSDDLEGVDPDGTPFGLMKWGQAGVYNAVDDRVIITALSDSQYGVVRGAQFSAGSGMTVNVSAGWMAIASCADGTSAVVSSSQTHQVQVPAGSPAGDTQYVVWIDTNVDAARWEMRVIARGLERVRSGVSLGVIRVPQGANLASQIQFDYEVAPVIGRHSEATLRTVTGTSFLDLAPTYALWTDTPLRRSHSAHLLRAFGIGAMGAAPQTPIWRLAPQDQTAVLGIHTGVGSSLPNQPWLYARAAFSWEAEGMFQLDAAGVLIRMKMAVTLSLKLSHDTIHPSQTIRAVNSWPGRSATHTSMHMRMQFAWGGNSAGQSLTCYGSTFENYQPWTD